MKLTHPKNGTVIEASGDLAKKFIAQGWKKPPTAGEAGEAKAVKAVEAKAKKDADKAAADVAAKEAADADKAAKK